MNIVVKKLDYTGVAKLKHQFLLGQYWKVSINLKTLYYTNNWRLLWDLCDIVTIAEECGKLFWFLIVKPINVFGFVDTWSITFYKTFTDLLYPYMALQKQLKLFCRFWLSLSLHDTAEELYLHYLKFSLVYIIFMKVSLYYYNTLLPYNVNNSWF